MKVLLKLVVMALRYLKPLDGWLSANLCGCQIIMRRDSLFVCVGG